MKKYVLLGATEQAEKLLSILSPGEVVFVLDENRGGQEIGGRKVHTSADMPPIPDEIEIVLCHTNLEDIQYMRENGIPFLFSTEVLLEKEIFDPIWYPEPMREMLNTYGKTSFTKVTKEELREFSSMADRYQRIIIGVMHPTSIGGFAWTCGRYCEYAENVKDETTLLAVCKGEHPIMETHKKFKIPNEFIYRKMLEKFPAIHNENVNLWCTYLCHHLDKMQVFDYWNAMAVTKEQAHFFFASEIKDLPKAHPPKERLPLSFAEQEQGEEMAHDMGILRKYVCFFARDNAYIRKTHKNIPADSFTDSDKYRNSDVNSFKLMDTNLKKMGIQSVRMGAVVDRSYDGEGVDYSNLGRSEFMDTYLFSQCLFFVADVSGIDRIPSELYTKPMVGIIPPVNILYQGDIAGRYELILPKPMYHRGEQRLLPLRYLLEISSALNYYIYKFYPFWNTQDIEVEQISDVDIWEAAEEMVNLLNGTQRYTREDLELRERYRQIIWEHLQKSDSLDAVQGYPSISWLRKNQWFLE